MSIGVNVFASAPAPCSCGSCSGSRRGLIGLPAGTLPSVASPVARAPPSRSLPLLSHAGTIVMAASVARRVRGHMFGTSSSSVELPYVSRSSKASIAEAGSSTGEVPKACALRERHDMCALRGEDRGGAIGGEWSGAARHKERERVETEIHSSGNG